LQVICIWLVIFIYTLINFALYRVIENFMGDEDLIEGVVNSNFFDSFPKFLKNFFGGSEIFISKEYFAVIGLSLITICFFLYYLYTFWEKKLKTRSKNYIKDLLLDKFRQLPFEERQVKKSEINMLARIDSVNVGEYWNRIYTWFFGIFIFIILNLWTVISYLEINSLGDLSGKSIYFSLSLILVISIVVFLLGRRSHHSKKKYKELVDEENKLISKEINNSILIDSMGLSNEYRSRQRSEVKKNQPLEFKFDQTETLNRVIPKRSVDFYPFALLLIGGKNFAKVLYIFNTIFNYLGDLFDIAIEYPEYSSSLEKINNFLALPEKDDNLSGLKLEKEKIKWIEFRNVYFRYQGETKWVLENCQAVFNANELNKLSGDNGTGKTTILYLLLGMIKPNSGQILIHCQNGEVYNLAKDINLQHWRENNTAYFSHDNLIEEGSTGQRQVKSINSTLLLKKRVQIIIFDEATNALDPENAEWIKEKIAKLVKEGKIVIFVEHFK